MLTKLLFSLLDIGLLKLQNLALRRKANDNLYLPYFRAAYHELISYPIVIEDNVDSEPVVFSEISLMILNTV